MFVCLSLYLSAHPDLLLSHSETMASINDNSMKELNGVLSTVKLPSEYPPAIDKVFVFYMKRGTDYEKFSLHLETSGGDSRKQLKTTFEEFFARTDINHTSFRWDKEVSQGVNLTELLV
jgi:hypothetical protein